MGSTRLPGKMMMPIGKYTLLSLVIERVKQAALVDKVILASTGTAIDVPLLKEAEKRGSISFAGSENDVLDRYYQCAVLHQASIIIRVTGDCPLIDPRIIDQIISLFKTGNVAYASNFHPPTYPNGFDVEIFSFAALEKAWNEAMLLSEREHVTPYLWKNPHLFSQTNLAYRRDVSKIRLTVDEQADLQAVNAVARYIDPLTASMEDILAVVESHPEICAYNKHITRNQGYEKSIKNDALMKR